MPVKVISDNGSHFSASAYILFCKRWGFELILSSPEYPRGHALIERHVQTVKKCMKKCDRSGFDFDLAMLALRSTPLDSHLPSPAELLNGRKFRTTVPMIVSDSPGSHVVQQRLKLKQKLGAEIYNRGTRNKPDLTPGDACRLYNKDTRIWEPATVTEYADTPRSYIVQRTRGGIPLRRNRQHLKSTIETWNKSHYEDTSDEVSCNDEVPCSKSPVEEPQCSPPVHREEPVSTPSSRPTRARRQTVFYQAS
jgi:hypothetical protein